MIYEEKLMSIESFEHLTNVKLEVKINSQNIHKFPPKNQFKINYFKNIHRHPSHPQQHVEHKSGKIFRISLFFSHPLEQHGPKNFSDKLKNSRKFIPTLAYLPANLMLILSFFSISTRIFIQQLPK